MLRDGSPPASVTALPKGSSIDPLVGGVLQGTYAIDRLIGSGGMSHIYEAHHVRLEGHRFAVKILLEDLATNQDLVARFQREIAAVARIDHPRVVRVYDCGVTTHGRPYMVTELLVGMDLSAWLGKFGPLSVPTALHVGQCLAEALRTTHSHGVIHRDLKPSNVFLAGDFSRGPPHTPTVKVLDFGLSRFLDRDDELTKTRLVMGTPAYMSPEQANGERGTHSSDIYGLGAVLYAAVTGEAPFNGSTPQQTVLSVLGGHAVRPRKLKPSIPEGLEVVIQCCMAKRPEERYREVRDVERSLANLAGRPSERALIGQEEAQRSRRAWPMRAQFVGLLMLSALWHGAVAATAFSSVWAVVHEELRFTPTSAALGSVALVGVVALGTALVLHVRRSVWPDSPSLRAWLGGLRGNLWGAILAYGMASVLVHLGRTASASNWLVLPFRIHPAEWPGWPMLFAVESLLGAVALGWLHSQSSREGRLRFRAAPWVSVACVGLCLLLLTWGGTQSRQTQIAVARLARNVASSAFSPSSSSPPSVSNQGSSRSSGEGRVLEPRASTPTGQSVNSMAIDAGAAAQGDQVIIDIDHLPDAAAPMVDAAIR